MKRPFLKWAGGKHKLAERFRPLLRLGGRRLVEPFAGSGALSLALHEEPRALWLNDINPDLARLHEQVRDRSEALVHALQPLFTPSNNTPGAYYALRDEFNETTDPLRKAALFVYLNRHGYNGLCRYNASGGFNVPFGRYKHPRPPSDEIQAAAGALKTARITHLDFTEVLAECGQGDAVYCDPPYVTLSKTASFTAYSKDAFPSASQAKLVRLAREAARRGAVVVISNHDTPEARALYEGATIHAFDVRRSISRKSETRGLVKELVAVYG